MFSFFKRKEPAYPTEKQFVEGLQAAQYRHRMDSIYAKYQLPARENGGLLVEVAAVAVLGTERIAATVGVGICSRTPGSVRLALATIAVIASDHLSRQALIEFELASLAAVYRLLGGNDQEEHGKLAVLAIQFFNALSERNHSALMGVGQAFAEFFATAEEFCLLEARTHALTILRIAENSIVRPAT